MKKFLLVLLAALAVTASACKAQESAPQAGSGVAEDETSAPETVSEGPGGREPRGTLGAEPLTDKRLLALPKACAVKPPVLARKNAKFQ